LPIRRVTAQSHPSSAPVQSCPGTHPCFTQPIHWAVFLKTAVKFSVLIKQARLLYSVRFSRGRRPARREKNSIPCLHP